MTGRVLPLQEVLQADARATRLTERYLQWELLRKSRKTDWEEVRRYVYATDTTQTTNAQLPWKNKTTVPKLCQISDNLFSNYVATIFPNRKPVIWEANEKDANSVDKRNAIQNYMNWCIRQPFFKQEMFKIILDYIHMGNGFGTVEWIDRRVELKDRTQSGFIGPTIRRVSPLDIVMNPTSENFVAAPKFIRSIISTGELRQLLERMSNDENQDTYKKLYDYLREIRYHAHNFQGDWYQQDHLYAMDGFTSFREYLKSDMCEVLTFYGDWYDWHNDVYEKNKVITVVDRHKLINEKDNPSYFGYAPIYHVPWRKRQDNLWGMGPLDNLVGMQYRLDHIENMRADVVDLTTYPVQKIKGFVEDYTWQPGEKIFIGDEGDVELVSPEVSVLNAQFELNQLAQLMEEMAGAPKEAMGFRSPGEKTKYEVQRLENASSRIYSNKIRQFSEEMFEPLLNAMLEMARRNLTGSVTIPVFDDEFKMTTFQTLTVEDITGVGRIRPSGPLHFAEQAELIQNLTNLTGSNLWPLVQSHFSGIKLAKIVEGIFNLDEYEVVTPFIGLAEQADAQKQINALQEQVHAAAGTATGMGEDYDMDQHFQPQPAFGMHRAPPANATPGGMLGTM